MKLTCIICYKTKNTSKFDTDKHTEDGYSNVCMDCKEKKLRRLITNRDWHRKVKQKCIDYKGGKCSICGYNRCLAALDFHHIFPKKKGIRRIREISWRKWDNKLKKELDGCILVCGNCHQEIHHPFECTFD